MTFPTTEDNTNDTTIFRPVVYVNWFLRTIPRLVSQQRYLAYASEVGESFRPIIPKYVVNFSYAASIFYVLTDIGVRTQGMYEQKKPNKEIAIKVTDLLIWHSFASMILPAFTVHSIVKYSNKGVSMFNMIRDKDKNLIQHKCGNSFKPTLEMFSYRSRIQAWLPTMIALACIPFIIHPIDHATDFVMDNSIRKLYGE